MVFASLLLESQSAQFMLLDCLTCHAPSVLFCSWGVLFSHPADYTPVCTTELGAVAALIPEFQKRDAKVIALSCDPVESHKGWIKDIQVAEGSGPSAVHTNHAIIVAQNVLRCIMVVLSSKISLCAVMQ